jgi:hypothetical protein
LGFKLSTREMISVAFMIMNDHLDHFLSEVDCHILSFDTFGAILVEHLLCKLGRWEDRVGKDEMRKICDNALKQSDWKRGENDKDAMHFPFPHDSTSERLEKVLQQVIADMEVGVFHSQTLFDREKWSERGLSSGLSSS